MGTWPARSSGPVLFVMDEIRLTPRLLTAAELVEPGARVADVGTDHGYLPVWLRQTGRSPFVVASDLRPDPLASARASAARWDVTGIDFRLCPGLEGIAPREVDTVVIAGMSGETMVSILSDAAWDWTGKRLILQPMTKRPELLTWLYDHGLHLCRETLVPEREKLYWVLCAEPGREPLPRPAHLWAGFTETEYARRLRRRLRKALEGLRKAKEPREEERRRIQMLLEDMEDAYGW